MKEIEEASLVPGEDEELEAQFRKFSNGKKIMEGVNAAYSATGGEMESASERAFCQWIWHRISSL